MKSLLSFFVSNEKLEPTLEESLFFALMSSIPGQSWYSLKDESGKEDGQSFVAGIVLPTGSIVFRFPLVFLEIAQGTGANFLPIHRSGESLSGASSAKALVRFANR